MTLVQDLPPGELKIQRIKRALAMLEEIKKLLIELKNE